MMDVPDPIDRHSDVELWGVTPSSILAANHARTQETSGKDWQLLLRHYDLWTLRTNYRPPWETYQDFISQLAEKWITPPLQQTAVFVDPQHYSRFITGCLYHNGSDGIIRLLNWASQQFDPETPTERITIQREDISQYAEQSDIRILASIDAVTYTPEGYVFDSSTVQSLSTGLASDRSHAAWVLLARLLERLSIDAPNKVIRDLLSALEFPVPETPPSTTAGSLPIYVLSRSLEPLIADLFSDELTETLRHLQSEMDSRIVSLEESWRVDFVTADQAEEVSWPLSKARAAVCAIGSQRGIPIAADWLVTEEDGEDIFTLHAQLQDAGLDVVLRDRLLTFNTAYATPVPPKPPLEKYQGWLEDKVGRLRKRKQVFAVVRDEVERLSERHRYELVEQVMHGFEEYEVRPTTFVYTMLDPDRLKQYSEEKYVGESKHLEDELRWIRQWRDEEPLDARPFASVLPEIISYPLEHDAVEPELQIMSPWFNFALQDYVALFNRLLENGVQVKMLFRLPTYRQWNRMQSQFFERIGDTHGNLQLRTYTRYREYREQSELSEIEERDDKHLDEFGVHAKMYVAGDQSNGALLAGSANLVENSLHFNPEVGIHTHDPNLIETARSYFDLVWQLAEADKIPEKVMFGEVPFKFYPKVYEP